MQKSARADPSPLLNQFGVHQGYLAGGPAEADESELEPEAKRLGKRRVLGLHIHESPIIAPEGARRKRQSVPAHYLLISHAHEDHIAAHLVVAAALNYSIKVFSSCANFPFMKLSLTHRLTGSPAPYLPF